MTRDEFMNVVYKELHSDGDNYRANRIIDAADYYAEDYAKENEPRWISVTERLPEDYQDVLVCGEGDFITCAQLIKGLFECGELELYGSIDGSKVIGADTFNVLAWMPLPTPYQPQKEVTE